MGSVHCYTIDFVYITPQGYKMVIDSEKSSFKVSKDPCPI